MSQKTNPTSLRLHKNNQNFSCASFADFFFTENYHYNFEIENYITAFLKQTKYSKAFFSTKNQYRNFSAWLFLHDSRVDKKVKSLFFKYKSLKKDKFLQDYSKTEIFRILNKTKQNQNTAFLEPQIFQKTAKQGHFFAKASDKSKISSSSISRKKQVESQLQQINSEGWIKNKYTFLSFIVSTLPNCKIKYCQQFFHLSCLLRKLEQANRSRAKEIPDTKVKNSKSVLVYEEENQFSKNTASLRNYLRNHFLRLKQIACFSWLPSHLMASLASAKLFTFGDGHHKSLIWFAKTMNLKGQSLYKSSIFTALQNRELASAKLKGHSVDYANFRFVKRFLLDGISEAERRSLREQVTEGERNTKNFFGLAVSHAVSVPHTFYASAFPIGLVMQLLIQDERKKGDLIEFAGLSLLKTKIEKENNKTSEYHSWRHLQIKDLHHLSLSPFQQKYAKICSRVTCFGYLPAPLSHFMISDENDNYKKVKIKPNTNRRFVSLRPKKQSKKEKLVSSLDLAFLDTICIQPIRFIRDRQNVISLLDQVIILLEKRVAWRKIKSFLFKDLSKDLQIRGIRFSCSGRLGGRSKKAQKAKTQCATFGETSLSAFSSKLIFGSKSAFTPYGKIGIKLWVCYKW